MQKRKQRRTEYRSQSGNNCGQRALLTHGYIGLCDHSTLTSENEPILHSNLPLKVYRYLLLS